MGLIKDFTEVEIRENIRMMLYGEAGVGKTTLATSAPNVLLLDFDGSVQRINVNHIMNISIVQIDNWDKAKQLLTDPNIHMFDTIVVDTVGKMISMIIDKVCAGREQPRIQDWGTINSEARTYIQRISALKKNLVFVAHRDTRQDGDKLQYVPMVREKVYNEIISDIDLLGYIEMKSNGGMQNRTITFDPTDYAQGKNTCQLPSRITIPRTIDSNGEEIAENNFLETVIFAKYREMVAEKKKKAKEHDDVMAELTAMVSAITDADGINAFVKEVQTFKHVGPSKAKIRPILGAKIKELGLEYNEETNKYE